MKEEGSKAKLRKFFLENVGKVLSRAELFPASGSKSEWARRIRELRDEEGMQILTHNDRSDLKLGEYLLENTKLKPAFAREMSKELRALVLDRNGNTCQMCGAAAGEIHPFDGKPVRLHIGHIIDKSAGGLDELSNLRALCSLCNEGASNITVNRPDAKKLLIQIRRAPGIDQVEVLKWLSQKYPSQAKEFIKLSGESSI